MKPLEPFANESQSIGIGDLTVENHTDRVALYGSVDLTRDKAGLAQARRLKALLDQVVATLEAARDLPESLPPPEKPGKVPNPFA
jgi:hypothetical protein